MTTRPDTTGKLPLTDLGEMKRRGERIVMVTAYDFPSGRLADEAGVDMVLVGDSLGMVVQGLATTIPVTLEEMAYHCRAVARGHRAAGERGGPGERHARGADRDGGDLRHDAAPCWPLRKGALRRRAGARPEAGGSPPG